MSQNRFCFTQHVQVLPLQVLEIHYSCNPEMLGSSKHMASVIDKVLNHIPLKPQQDFLAILQRWTYFQASHSEITCFD